jgi:hypothetical protein
MDDVFGFILTEGQRQKVSAHLLRARRYASRGLGAVFCQVFDFDDPDDANVYVKGSYVGPEKAERIKAILEE